MTSKTLSVNSKVFLTIICIGSVFLFPFLGWVNLFDWDEANFAEIAREMILTDNYLQPQINYLPFYEKPPVFIWMQVISMKLFGISEYAARFPNAILAIFQAIAIYRIGTSLENQKFGITWVLCYFGSLLPFLYTRTGLIDPWFNFFMFLGLFFYHQLCLKNNSSWTWKMLLNLLLSSLFVGLAVQTKGPVALIIVWGTVGIYFLFSRFSFFPGWSGLVVWIGSTIVFSSLWFIYETSIHGTNYLFEFFKYQVRLFSTEDALHGGPVYYHFLVLLLGCLPASIFLFNRRYKELIYTHWSKLLIICGSIVLILFSIVQTKIIHYSSMAYFPISYLAALYLYKFKISKRVYYALLTFYIVLGIILIVLPYLGLNLHEFLPYLKDNQARQQLMIQVNWTYGDYLWGIVFVLLLFLIYKSNLSLTIKTFSIFPIFISIFWIGFSKKIERYTQGELIDFYKSKSSVNVDIKPLYIKSYACLFYANKRPFLNDTTKDHIYYLYDTLNRPVYFVLRNKDAYNIDTIVLKDVRLVKRSNGYSFFVRGGDLTN